MSLNPLRLTMDEMIFRLCKVAQKAGSEIIGVRETSKPEEFELKGDGSPVTVADLRAHQIIEEALSKIHPEIPIVSEEGSTGDPLSNELCFLVDPLDGTKEFIRGNSMYTVNIALMERRENCRWSPILGVVHAPEFGITWFGGRGMEAKRQDTGGIEEISAGTNNSAPVIVVSVSHASPKDRAFADSIGQHILEGVGSSIKICRVAEGSADMAPRFGTTSCWDTAAAHAVLNSAGGNLLGPDGAELDYDLVEDILNPWFLATSNGKWVDLWIEHLA